MTVDVTEQEDVAILLKLLDHHFGVIDRRMYFPLRVIPDTVEVDTSQVATGGAIDHTVGVKHRDDLEDEVVSQDLSVQGRTSQVVKDSLHDPRGGTLTRVNTTGNNDTFPVLDGIRIALKSGYDNHLAIIPGDRWGQGTSPQAILALRVKLQVI